MKVPGIHARLSTGFERFQLDVALELPGDGVTALFGHSGCGKTTLLRCIAGLQPCTGRLSVNGNVWQDDDTSLPVHKRPLAYVFQETSLFPHLSVNGNLNYGYRRTPMAQRRIHPSQVIDWLGLSHFMDRRPERLSGGERQRVAIARALLTSPRLLLMDEPLSALDQTSKREILPYLENLRDTLDIPIIYVSHSAAEVARLADYIVMMDQGRVVAEGGIQETLARPDQPFALEEGAAVIVPAVIRERDPQWHLCRAEFDGGSLWLRDDRQPEPGSRVRLQILARDVSIALAANHNQSIQNLLPARVMDMAAEQRPGMTTVRLQAGQTSFLSRITSRSAHQLGLGCGMDVCMQIKSVAIVE
ncbi:molybdenum ABC transporter ATP-binding protein [Marinobacter vulgaris]|uniref:Molybdenum ABC transporter ATP-binding protein n=1 Tax=Marinobacter vulgaris TaxID=1928331 RepID=A0A2V3ZPX4_9GAMM|nr:molybdenum ABC transporter ATP-binding protein [Marinobacter vulgaris]PXX93412.1 molybdenum ABC transporter ATP-binding protein [Marinobacter vulgaris]TSJ72576.1 molybdenum ABC transporter ATP-binding protein [Marinobacter vulgaris]